MEHITEDRPASKDDTVISQTFPQNVWDLYWVAVYKRVRTNELTGEAEYYFEYFNQYNEDGTENKYADINRDRLVRFDMVQKKDKKVVYSLYLHSGQRLIFRRRTLKKINQPDTVIFLVGYQHTVMTGSGAQKFNVINYLHPDGSIALDGARSNLELLNFEK